MPRTFSCETCFQSWEHDRILRKHYQKFPDHRKNELKHGGNTVLGAPAAVSSFLSVSTLYKKRRLRELCKRLSESDVEDCVVQALAPKLNLYSAFKWKCVTNYERSDIISENKLLINMSQLLKQLKSTHCKMFEFVLNSLGYMKRAESGKLLQGKENAVCSSHTITSQSVEHKSLTTNLSQVSVSAPSPIHAMRFTTPDRKALQPITNKQSVQIKNPQRFIEDISDTETLMQKLATVNRSQTIDAILKVEDGDFMKECNKKFYGKNRTVFDKMSTEIVTNFEISRRDYQTILRNTIGKTVQETIGFNPYVSKVKMEEGLQVMTRKLKADLGLAFAEWNEIVVGYTDIKKSLEWLVGRKSLADSIKLSTGKMVIFFYVDLFPWLQWSRFFTGETTVRLKILDHSNSFNSVITVASWLGTDKADYVANLGSHAFNQLKDIDTITHPITNSPVEVSCHVIF